MGSIAVKNNFNSNKITHIYIPLPPKKRLKSILQAYPEAPCLDQWSPFPPATAGAPAGRQSPSLFGKLVRAHEHVDDEEAIRHLLFLVSQSSPSQSQSAMSHAQCVSGNKHSALHS